MSTPDDQLRQLDQRATSAATGLRATADARPIPSFDPGRAIVTDLSTTRASRPGRALAVAAVLLVIAAIAGVLIAQGGDDGDDKAKVISSEPRPFVAGALPDGFRVGGAGEIDRDSGRLAEAGGEATVAPMTMYGPDEGDPQLGTLVFLDWSSDQAAEDGAGDVDLGGRTAYDYSGLGLGRQVLVVPDGDRALVIVSSTQDEDWVRDLADQATITDDDRVDLQGFDLPDGWRQVGEVPSLLALSSPMMASMDPGAVGRYTVYFRGGEASGSESDAGSASSSGPGSASGPVEESPEPEMFEDTGLLTVSSTPGDEAQVYAGALVADTTTTTTIRGHDARVTTTELDGEDPFTIRNVTWMERPGEVLRVSGTGLSEAELLAVATDVRPISSAEWKDLIERSQLGEFDTGVDGEPMPDEVGTGRFEDGTRWVLSVTVSDDESFPDSTVHLDVAVTDPQDGSSSSSGSSGTQLGGSDPGPIISTEVVTTDGKTFAGALVELDVARVEVLALDGSVIAEPEIVEGAAHRGVAVLLPSDVATLVAFAADGTELGRVELAGEGSTEEQTGSGTATTVVVPGPGD